MFSQSLRRYALLLLLLAIFAVFLVYPILLTVRGGFVDVDGDWTLRHVASVFQDPVLRGGLVNALLIAVATTLTCLIIALPLAVLSANFDYPGKKLWNAVILIPLILPPFVGAIGMQQLLGRFGAINALLGTEIDFLGSGRFWGVVLVEALHLYPILYLNATAALANLDPALDEAAENLGAGTTKRFFHVTLPLIRPGLFAGATIVFIWSFTELGTPLMFDFYEVTPVQIFQRIKEVEDSAKPYALTVVMLFSAAMLYIMGKMVFGGRAYAMYSKASISASTKRLGTGGALLAVALFAIVTFLAVLPHLGVLLSSFSGNGAWYRSVLPRVFTTEHFGDALGHPLAMGSIRNSLFYASTAMVIDIGLGVAIGYLIVRTKIIGRGLLDALSMLPLAVPGLVMAFGYVAMTLEPPFSWTAETAPAWGQWFVPIAGAFDIVGQTPNPVTLLIIAYAIRRLPYVVRSTVAGLEQTSHEMEEAALNLGASKFYAMRRVVVPLIMANLIAGGLLTFSFAMLEVSDSLILAQQTQYYPITKAIYTFAARLGDGQYIASAMGVWGMALLTVTLVGASLMLGKKLGAIFRV
jgi:iron(III) transport system permease protein